MLARGEWKLEGNLKDTELKITFPLLEDIPFANHLVLPCDTGVCLEILKQGTEREITVYATKL